MTYIPQILIICLLPWLLNKYLKDTKVGNILSPVVMAYVIGIAISFFKLIPLSEMFSDYISKVSIMIAIPLLLFSADIMAWINHAGKTVLSFGYAVVAALIRATLFAYLYMDKIPEAWNQSAMLLGVFTGGTATMQAVGIGLDVKTEIFAVLNSAEILWGGIYLLFLTSFAPKFYGIFLPEYEYDDNSIEYVEDEKSINYKTMLISIALATGIVAISVGASFLFFNGLESSTFIIIAITTVAVVFSFYQPVRDLKNSFEAGEYLLLVFCVAIGMISDFRKLIEEGGEVVLFAGGCMILTILIHLVLSVISKIDRDTTIITSTAAIYGPAFIGQIASVLKNRQIIFAGMATGIIGYVVGNYLGISLGKILFTLLN